MFVGLYVLRTSRVNSGLLGGGGPGGGLGGGTKNMDGGGPGGGRGCGAEKLHDVTFVDDARSHHIFRG